MNQAETLKQWKMQKAPEKPAAVMKQITRRKMMHHAPAVLSIGSGKGGVGKTNVVANLAVAFSRLGKRVMVLDADLGLANVDVLFGLAPKFTIQHVFNGEKELSDVVLTGPEGIQVLPASSGIPELTSLHPSEKLFLLGEMEQLNNSIDYLLIDTAAGISDNVLYFNMVAQQRIIVVTPEPTSITDAYALIKVLANRHDIKYFSILVNWAADEKEARKVYHQLTFVSDKFLGGLSLDFLGHIPRDEAVPRAVNKQKTVLQLFPGSEASKSLMNIAQNILDGGSNAYVDGNIKFFWRNLFGV